MKKIFEISSEWYDKRILITGGAGFIGSHLADQLVKENYYVNVIDDLSTGSYDNIRHLIDKPNFNFVMESDEEEIVMDRLISKSDLIFHLAAAVGVDLIVKNPVNVIQTNIQGTHMVLKLANRYRRKVLIASTSEIYGKSNEIPFKEDSDRVLGSTTKSRWCYSSSKAVDEFLGLAYYKTYDLPVVIFRLFNTVGPRQSGQYGMVVPRFIDQAIKGEKISIYGDGSQSRCFCNVSDVINAIIGLSDTDISHGQIYNIGSKKEISIKDLAQKVLELTGKTFSEDTVEFIPYEKAYEPGFEDMIRRIPDTTKIEKDIDWEAKISLEDTLKEILRSKE